MQLQCGQTGSYAATVVYSPCQSAISDANIKGLCTILWVADDVVDSYMQPLCSCVLDMGPYRVDTTAAGSTHRGAGVQKSGSLVPDADSASCRQASIVTDSCAEASSHVQLREGCEGCELEQTKVSDAAGRHPQLLQALKPSQHRDIDIANIVQPKVCQASEAQQWRELSSGLGGRCAVQAAQLREAGHQGRKVGSIQTGVPSIDVVEYQACHARHAQPCSHQLLPQAFWDHTGNQPQGDKLCQGTQGCVFCLLRCTVPQGAVEFKECKVRDGWQHR